jgi:hypothetical protein
MLSTVAIQAPRNSRCGMGGAGKGAWAVAAASSDTNDGRTRMRGAHVVPHRGSRRNRSMTRSGALERIATMAARVRTGVQSDGPPGTAGA